MQCLYCETELKPLRGLFDEDFCSKEHREKYFASFRKGITLLPDLDLPPLAPRQETNSEEIAPHSIESPLEVAPIAARHIEVEEEPAELPEPVIALVAAEPVRISAAAAKAVEEPAPVQLSPKPFLAVAEEERKVEPVLEVPLAAQKTAAKAPGLPAVEEPVAVGATVDAAFDDEEVEEAAFTPRAADFLHLNIAPFGANDCYFMVEEDSFSACNGPAIPDVEVFCDAAFDPDDGQADVFAATEMVAAGPASGETGRTGIVEPLPAVAAQFHSPSFHAWDYTTSVMPALEGAELIEDVEMFVAGAASGEMARSANGHLLVLPPVSLTVPAFDAQEGSKAQPHVAEPVQMDFVGQQIESAALMFSDMEPILEIHSLAFQVSAAAMQLDEDLKRAIEPPKTEAARLAEPEIARPAVMSAAPVGHAVSAATFQPTIPAASARPEAQLNVPAMSSRTDAEPRASEAMPDPPRGAAAEQPPSTFSPEPVQPAIQSSVKIKNWRLKITFAKPA